MTHEEFGAHVAMLLRDQPRGTTADLTDFAVAYWDDKRVRYVFLHEDGQDALDEELDLPDYLLDQWEVDFAVWSSEPHYSLRPQLLRWLKAGA
ncbi:hypothetical protein [Caballeronia sordidicola]|uniref:hypothetical protein n=1 Tax=Caballeronia sordidicola TaxID=196367 RepID=UPI0004CFEDFF|nr:hypothetical protein [Caballeronia sordidicola]